MVGKFKRGSSVNLPQSDRVRAMTDYQDDFSIIRTKLHRPRVPQNHVHRVTLVERLQHFNRRPVTLISAPAGYGKSTLVSCRLEMCGRPALVVPG